MRFDTPGYSFHKMTGTVCLGGSGSVFVLRDDRDVWKAEVLVASNELVRMRDQTPNPGHAPPGRVGAFWWRHCRQEWLRKHNPPLRVVGGKS